MIKRYLGNLVGCTMLIMFHYNIKVIWKSSLNKSVDTYLKNCIPWRQHIDLLMTNVNVLLLKLKVQYLVTKCHR